MICVGTSTCAGDDVISTPVTKAIMAIPTLRKTWISPAPADGLPRHVILPVAGLKMCGHTIRCNTDEYNAVRGHNIATGVVLNHVQGHIIVYMNILLFL
ncbi:hypothetical protein [Komagataeibacter oboediens]|uniref:hypothetical protein n=1 Tax=Komagataeibacter oboediens TaxID=65958 RepID=UPI001C2DC258|nr:hypothetical protein [Komagataeibacter oboediens]